MDRFFFRSYKWLNGQKLIGGLMLLLMLAGLIFLVTKIRFEEDISKLIPINSENRDFEKVLKTVNFTDKIIVNIQSKDTASVAKLTAYATDMVDSLEAHSNKYIKYIRGRVDEGNLQRTFDFVYENLPVLLDAEDYGLIAQRLAKDSISARTQANYRTLISPSGIVSKEMILRDPLGISFIALKKLRQLGITDQFVLKDGFLVSRDGRNILLFITPKFGSSETAENGKFAEQL